MATKQINFRIDAELENQIKGAAAQEGKTIGKWLQDLAKWALENNIIPDSSSNSRANTEYLEKIDQLEEQLNQHSTVIDEIQGRIAALENRYQNNSKSDSKGDSTSNSSRHLSGYQLAKRFNTSETTVRTHANRGELHFRQWSLSKDPNGLMWIRDPKTKKYQVARDDQSDYIINHKPADDGYLISNGDKS